MPTLLPPLFLSVPRMPSRQFTDAAELHLVALITWGQLENGPVSLCGKTGTLAWVLRHPITGDLLDIMLHSENRFSHLFFSFDLGQMAKLLCPIIKLC